MSLIDEIAEQQNSERYDPDRDVTVSALQVKLGCGREKAEGILLRMAREGKLQEVTVLMPGGRLSRAWRKA